MKSKRTGKRRSHPEPEWTEDGTIAQRVGWSLRLVRKAAGLSLATMAKRTNLPAKTIAAIENGTADLRQIDGSTIATAVGAALESKVESAARSKRAKAGGRIARRRKDSHAARDR